MFTCRVSSTHSAGPLVPADVGVVVRVDLAVLRGVQLADLVPLDGELGVVTIAKQTTPFVVGTLQVGDAGFPQSATNKIKCTKILRLFFKKNPGNAAWGK